VTTNAAPEFAALEGRPQNVFNAAAFRYFLEVERARAAQARQPSWLLLVPMPRGDRRVDGARPRVASRIFAALGRCVRDGDLVGWYREGSIAGAILTGTGPLCTSTRHTLTARVVHALMESLPTDEFTRVRVHVVIIAGTGRR
jgi:hypothetical protein